MIKTQNDALEVAGSKKMSNSQLIRKGYNAYRANRSVNNLRELLKMREINADDVNIASGPQSFNKMNQMYEKKMV